MHGQNFAVFEIVSFAPLVNPFFRLEEKHGRSGEGQVFVPAGEGQREMNKQAARGGVPAAGDCGGSNVSTFDFHLNRLIALRANRFDDRVRVERGRDAEHIPGAVGEIGLVIGLDFEVRRNP